MADLRGSATIRDRGQLTIPDKFRVALKWPSPNSVVSIRVTVDNKLVIEPYNQRATQEIDWNDIWKRVKQSRSYKGKNKKSLSHFIAKDRHAH